MGTSIIRWVFAALLVAFFSSHAFAQRNLSVAPAGASEQRVALVIGNSAYKESPLANPVNDATDIAKALQEAGFKVILKRNATTRDMRQAIREFGAELRRSQVGLFYFAGHGIQVKGNNYLVPVGADIESEADAEDLAIDANYALRTMEEAQAKVSIVVLDACRNNPFARSFRSASRGLAQMNAATGSLVAFATAPGSVAADGSGRNGIYTKHLLASLSQPDTDILKVFQRTRAAVVKETGGKQTPWESTSLIGDFHFRPPVGGAQVASAAPASAAQSAPVRLQSAAEIEQQHWDAIKDSKDARDFQDYLVEYPSGRFAVVARARVKTLQAAPPTQLATAAPSVQTLAPTAVADDLQRLAAGTVFQDCADCPEMVVIPPGNYLMGGSRSISLPRAFAVGKFEVTFAQWDACVAAGGCNKYKPPDEGWGRGSRPVINVSWDDAKWYAAWLTQKSRKSYRLLTEAEWEYAARAGTTTAYYWGDSDADICRYASVDKGGRGCGANKTSLVGERRPNAFGLHDMLGNVSEWTEDCWNERIDGAPADASARTTGDCRERVFRGGSWLDNPQYARAAKRNNFLRDLRAFVTLGFRVARTQ